MATTIRNKQSLTRLTQYLILPILILRRSTTSRFLGTLAFEEIRASSTERPYAFTALVLHGLLGSARNWRSFSRTLVSYLSNSSPSSDWRMVLVDLRNHGRSTEIEGLSPPHDMTNAAKDVADLVNTQGWGWPHVVVGHSMGGKVALQFAESCARGDYGESAHLPKQVFIFVGLTQVNEI